MQLAGIITGLWRARALWIAAASVLIMPLLAPSPALAAPAGPTEYEVKAAFLFNFAKFIDWPTNAFSNSDSPLIIGLMGDDPFGGALEAVIQNKTIHDRKLVLRRLSPGEDLRACHILFVSPSEKQRFEEILTQVKQSAVLTVSESDQFLQHGGIINFYLESGRVRFAINADAAERAGLKISSKLLSVAKVVKTDTSQ